MARRAHLARILARSRAGFRPAGDRLLILTGQSDLSDSRLSPAQAEFLAEAVPAGWYLEPGGFPYDGLHDGQGPIRQHGYRLLPAMLSNARQFGWAHLDGNYRGACAELVQALRQATAGRLVFLTGSCGLAILAGALAGLDAPPPRISVLAFGPAGPVPPVHRFRSVVGRTDRWSRLLHRRAPDRVIECGHMDYWRSPEALREARAFLREVA